MVARPPLPPFTGGTAAEMPRAAEDAWTMRAPDSKGHARTDESLWRNRTEAVPGRLMTTVFWQREWARKVNAPILKDVWADAGSCVSMRFVRKHHDTSGQGFQAHANAWRALGHAGQMCRRASINGVPIHDADRLSRWPPGVRPPDHRGLTVLGL